MSQCSFLYSAKSNSPNDTSSSSEMFEVCGSHIPLIWLTMYTANDVMAKDYNYEEETDGYLICCTSKESALSNMIARENSLKKLIPAKYHSHIEKFKNMIESSSNRYIVVSIDDIESMSDEPLSKCAEFWRDILSGLDSEVSTIRVGIKKIFRGSGIPSSWRALISRSTGNYSTLRDLEFNNQWLLSGFARAEEMDEWEL